MAGPEVIAAENCHIDTSQSDFQQGTPTSVALLGNGDVTLASSETVDQKNESLSSDGFSFPFHTYWWFGQTFRAGVSGPLTAADVRIFCNGCTGTPPDLTVSIRATSGGVPTGPDLATATIPGSLSPTGGYYKATFANPMNMVAGTTYALLVRANAMPQSGSYAYMVSAGDTAYPDGQRLTSTTAGNSWDARDRDIGFHIYTGSGYVAAGNLISSLKDSNPAGGNPTWTNITWAGTTPGSTTLRFQAAASNSASGPFNFVGPDGTASSYFTSSGASLNQFNGLRYLKYKALLSTSNSAVTPVLQEAKVCHDVATVAPSANLGITKTNGTSTSTPGGSTTYTIVASNAGPSSVTGATVTDSFPSSLQNCTWTCAGGNGGSCPASGSGNINASVNLPVNGTATFTANCGIKSNATGSLVNTATISSSVSDPVPGNNSATDTDTLAPSANLSITKTDGVSTATPGEEVVYTITASNAGPSNVPSATVTDNFPSSLENCEWLCEGQSGGSCNGFGAGNINQTVNLPAGGKTVFTAICKIKSTATGSLSNTATVSSSVADPVPGNNSATDTDTLNAVADLQIDLNKAQDIAPPGGQATFKIIARNTGSSSVSGASVESPIPSDMSCSWTSQASGGATSTPSGTGPIDDTVNLPVNASATYNVNCSIAPHAKGSLVIGASISSPIPDPTPENNSASDSITVQTEVIFRNGFD